MSKVRASRAISDRPSIVSGGLQPLADLDVPTLSHTRPATDTLDHRVGGKRDPLIGEQLFHFLSHIGILAVDQTGCLLYDRNPAAEAAKRLDQLQPYVATAENEEMLGHLIEFEGL